VGRTGEVEAEAEEKIEVWDREALKRREKKRKTEENRRAFRARAESWVKPKDRTWKWLYRAKTVPPQTRTTKQS
jgi:thymidylate synthase